MDGVRSMRPSVAKLKPPEIHPTDEQAHILDLYTTCDRNLIINALAGTGKTSTLKLIAHVKPQPMLYLAFNKRIVEEAEADRNAFYAGEPVLAFPDTTEIRTFNSLGYQIWRQDLGLKKLNVNGRKNSDLLREAIYARPKTYRSEAFDQFLDITSALGLAKSLGYLPPGKFRNARALCDGDVLQSRLDTQLTDLGWDLLDEVLVASIQASYGGSVDFDDQIYMPALFGGTFPVHPTVVVDETQDLNPCNRAMLERLHKSRIVAVGDDGQSIYAFRGAIPGGMEIIKADLNALEASLTVSFRCPRAIVEAVHWHKPNMKWVKDGGRATRLLMPKPNQFVDGCAIICRNNAPLFALALRLLASGRSVSVHGSEVGPKVVAIMRKLGDENMSQKETLSAIDWWLQEKLARQSSTASDIADCMRVFARNGDTLSGAISWAQDLFAQEGTIQLLTGHKAKGLEWDIVFHLDPWLIRDEKDEQERNLRYVITTRAKESLYEIDGKEIRWS